VERLEFPAAATRFRRRYSESHFRFFGADIFFAMRPIFGDFNQFSAKHCGFS
jgi:hypothetical protein